MVLVREVQELHVRGPARTGGQPGPQAQRLPHRDPVVLVAVDHQHRSGDRIQVMVGRVRQVALRVRERVTKMTPPVRGHVGRAEHLVQRPQAGVADDRPEPAGVTGDPVGHVPPVGAAHRRRPRLVDVGAGDGGVCDRHQVGVGPRPPVAVAAADKVMTVAGGQAGVGQQHGIPASGHQPRVPPPRPGVPAHARPAVDPQQQRRGLLFRGCRGQRQPAPDDRPVVGGRLHLGEPARQLGLAGRAGQDLRWAARQREIDPDRRRRAVHRGAQRVQEPAVR